MKKLNVGDIFRRNSRSVKNSSYKEQGFMIIHSITDEKIQGFSCFNEDSFFWSLDRNSSLEENILSLWEPIKEKN